MNTKTLNLIVKMAPAILSGVLAFVQAYREDMWKNDIEKRLESIEVENE